MSRLLAMLFFHVGRHVHHESHSFRSYVSFPTQVVRSYLMSRSATMSFVRVKRLVVLVSRSFHHAVSLHRDAVRSDVVTHSRGWPFGCLLGSSCGVRLSFGRSASFGQDGVRSCHVIQSSEISCVRLRGVHSVSGSFGSPKWFTPLMMRSLRAFGSLGE